MALRCHSDYVISMIDLYHFKRINDEYGHLAGDRALQQVAGLFQQRLRVSDTFCRFGGEEFLVFLPNTKLENAGKLFQALLEQLGNSPLIINDDGTTIRITVSFGLASLEKGDSLNTVIQRADEHLYRAKVNGRNRLSYPVPAD